MTMDQRRDPAEQLHGTWKMRSWRVEDLATGQRSDALGAAPRGYISYTPDGRVLVVVTAGDRARPAELVPSPQEKVGLYDSLFAYGGTFNFDGAKVTHHIDISWNEAWCGTHQVRFAQLDGDTLTYVSAPARNPMTGNDCQHTVVLDRVQGLPAGSSPP